MLINKKKMNLWYREFCCLTDWKRRKESKCLYLIWEPKKMMNMKVYMIAIVAGCRKKILIGSEIKGRIKTIHQC